jgi:hypothetical protein
VRTRSRDDFTTIRTEGQILPPDLLTRIVERDKELEGLDPGSYHLVGQTINEAISRSWTVLQGAWSAFKDRRAALPEGQPETQMTRERWLLPLFRELDYGRLETMRAVEIEGKSYPISHRWLHTPIHLVGFRTDLDKRTPGVAGAARISPHGLVQEFVNRSEDHLWAFLSDGLRLRILRDNASLTRQAYVEFDLEAMMDGEVYPDFVLLWLICHQSRVEADRPEECHLEKWSRAAAQRGTRALEGLRDGVEEAISSLGSGFLSRRANDDLRNRLRSGELDTQDYYRQLLRLVYRLLFLFVAEDRSLLLDPDADDAAKDRYTRFYSTRKLRSVAEKRVGARHSDLYHVLSLVMDRLGDERGCPELGLPALGSFLFCREAMPDLTGAEVFNRSLLDAVRALSYTVMDGAYRAVDYKNLGAEELGSVYESLLELQPELDSASGSFTLRAVTGNERKTTGSYYTPHSLVTSLLDTALDPVLDEAARKPDPEAAILDLKVCDPAVGSGHSLIAAAHRMAKRLASVRTGDDEPSPQATREALRDVIGRCLNGVDVNPMAAELCRVSLWMEALVPGRPLSFLDHHIQVGNSLLGTTSELISGGIPDDAFKRIEGDDNKLTSDYRKRNREERKAWESGQLSFSLRTLDKNREAIERGYEQVDEVSEGSVTAVREKAARYAALQQSDEMFHARRLADAWCAAFVWPKREGAPDAITHAAFAHLTQNAHALSGRTEDEIEQISGDYNLFHWDLAFPDVFGEDGAGGFDVVLGNPPWERTALQELEFFATRSSEVLNAPTTYQRKTVISRLKEENPALFREYLDAKRRADGEGHFYKNSERYPLGASGRINTYALFADLMRSLINPDGRTGVIVQTSIATDAPMEHFWRYLVASRRLCSIIDFENRERLFPSVHTEQKFCLLTVAGSGQPMETQIRIGFWLTNPSQMSDTTRVYNLSLNELNVISPNTSQPPLCRTERDFRLLSSIHHRTSVMDPYGQGGAWAEAWVALTSASASRHFTPREELVNGSVLASGAIEFDGQRFVPLIEAKQIHQFDYTYATYEGTSDQARRSGEPRLIANHERNASCRPVPRYWGHEDVVNDMYFRKKWEKEWIVGLRDVTNVNNERTAISCVLPAVGLVQPLNGISCSHAEDALLLAGALNSFAVDYVARQKIASRHLNVTTFSQLPAPPDNAEWLTRVAIRGALDSPTQRGTFSPSPVT